MLTSFRIGPMVSSKAQSDAADAIASARAAQPAWAATAVRDRLAVIRRVRCRIVESATQLAEAVHPGRGVPPAETLAAEVLPLADACRFLERSAVRLLKPRRLGRKGRPLWLTGVDTEVLREPFGVILVIGPSNYPLFLPGVQALQALTAGNAVLWKPGAGEGGAAHAFADLLASAGLDPRLLRILSDEPEAAQAAIEAGIDKVVLTGSAQTGMAILRQLAPRLVPATVELSGCDAAFVRADADLDLVVRALQFALRWNDGETCIAPHRIFVASEIVEELERRLTDAARQIPSRALRTETAELIKDALDRGGRLLAGQVMPDNQGLVVPVIVSGGAADWPLLHGEIYGPLLVLVPVGDENEALRITAQCPYALGAAVFGEESWARAFARRIRAGVVVINDVIVPTADPRLPFGGSGRSGFGVTRGAEGLLELTTL
jgi:acyl-CoA reductase-like NAD-dependent aldehyde dehydrogenase